MRPQLRPVCALSVIAGCCLALPLNGEQAGVGGYGYSHTIVIDGVNDFTADEQFATTTAGYTGFITWDSTHLYVGFEGPAIGSGSASEWLWLYLGGSPGTTTGITFGACQPTLATPARYLVAWRFDGATAAYEFDGVSWVASGWDLTDDYWSSGAYLEMRVALADLGSPETVGVHLNLNDEAVTWTWAGVPHTSFTDGACPSFGGYFEFDLDSPTVPNAYPPQPEPEPIFADDLESGWICGWSQTTPLPTSFNVLSVTYRDFMDSHPDFEGNIGFEAGLVELNLGADRKPVYAGPPGGTVTTSGPENFSHWFNDEPGTNINIPGQLQLVQYPPPDDATWGFQIWSYHPIDDQGFGNQGRPNNYHFTVELHTSFLYSGGESFSVQADDDLWLFVNDRLLIDLGGVHGIVSDSVDLDSWAATLGLSTGNFYDLALFHAERHTWESALTIETTIPCFAPH